MTQLQERAQQRGPRAASPNGHHGDAAPDDSGLPSGFVRPPGLLALALGAVAVAVLGLVFWQQQLAYVTTDHAIVSGTVVQLGSPTNGQVRSTTVEVGDEVRRGQVVATVALASPQNSPQAPVTQASVRSTIDGVVVARHASPGDAISAGRPIVSVVDPTALSVQAQIDEPVVGRVRPGQHVEVTIPALGRVLAGRVAAVGPASSTAASQLAQGSSAFGPSRTNLTVPVRIDVDPEDAQLVLGASASVRIRVQD